PYKIGGGEPNPPLWLTVFGGGGHWPIRAFGSAPIPDMKRVYLPSSWKAVCALLCVLAGFHPPLFFWVASFFSTIPCVMFGTVAPARQLFGIHAASAALALALFFVASSAWEPNVGTRVSVWAVWILPIACWALTFKYCCWCWADRAKVPEEWYVRPRPRPVTI